MDINKTGEKIVVVSKQVGIRRMIKKKQKPKLVLTSPYDLTWPTVPEKDELLIRDKLKSTLSSLSIERWKGRIQHEDSPNLDMKKKNENKKIQRKEYWKKSSEHRSHFVMGLSSIIRGLEKDELLAVLVSKNVKPNALISPILSLCCARNVHAAAVKDLGTTLQNCLNLRSCAAFGFKKSIESLGKSHLIYQLLEDLRCILPPLPTILEASYEVLPATIASDKSIRCSVQPPISKDYSHLYIRKDQVTLPKSSDDFLSFNTNGKSAEVASGETNRTAVNGHSRKRLHGLKMKKINPKKVKQ